MRIDMVKAVAFGPFAGETLELVPGMNVIFGPNESGKSSWHSAIYRALRYEEDPRPANARGP
jgi:exonuclease SbcC